MDDIEQEIDLDQITDENLLQNLLDQTDDPEDRKVIRDRIKELRATKKNERDEKLTKLTNTREEMLQTKKREAEQLKQKTMAMYDNMAKSAPAGDQKKMDVNILKTETTKTTTSTTKLSTFNQPKVDLVEDAIKKRQREAEERKKRILTAFDVAAKSTPAGAPKEVDFEIDVSRYENTETKKESDSTFQMSGGVSIVKKGSVPSTPVNENGKPNFGDESHLDSMERALRERQRDCEERKQKMLEQYNQISKQQAGKKMMSFY